MKKTFCALALISVAVLPGMTASAGGVPTPHRAAPTLEQRVADSEAHVNNTWRGADTPSNQVRLVLEQLKAIGVTLVLAIAGATVIAYIVKALVGLRPSEEVETIGLDLAEHGEEGYHG
jgi:ammonia channel protein AmtB